MDQISQFIWQMLWNGGMFCFSILHRWFLIFKMALFSELPIMFCFRVHILSSVFRIGLT
jgi:hypothetical protein